jgi:DNA-binding CsgD family transcriptional regulator
MVALIEPFSPTGGETPFEPRSGRFDEKLVIVVLQMICSVILVFDVGGEIHAAMLDDQPTKPGTLFHLWIEVFATFLMGFAFTLSYRQLRNHRLALARAKGQIEAVRGDFTELVDKRFREWGLSPAEFEIALLTVKGLRIAEIARLRDCRESTVKSHLSAIFRKAEVTSRTELLARFVDDFLTRSSEL